MSAGKAARSLALAVLAASTLCLSPASQAQREFVRGRVLVKFRQGASELAAQNGLAALGGRQVDLIPGLGVRVVSLPPWVSEAAAANALARRPDVEYAEPDYLFPSQNALTPNDPWFANWQWNLKKMECPEAWGLTTGNPGMGIAILDTGVDASHPDLAPKMLPGWNAYDQNDDTRDVGSHGTTAAGAAAAATNNGLGVAGVAWSCKIVPIRVTDAGGYGMASAMARGLLWAADHGIRVANLSYIVHTSVTVTDAARYYRDAGGVLTTGAGNFGTFDPAPDNPYMLTVGMVTSSDVCTSNTGAFVDLCAPNTTYSTYPGGSYTTVAGTSYAAPMVAGVAALVLSSKPSASPAEVEAILEQSAVDLGPAGYDMSYGWGRVNARRAVALALGGSSPPPDTTPPAVTLSSPLNGATVSGTVSVQASATDNVAVQRVTLYVDGSQVATNLSNACSYSWVTTNWPNGSHCVRAVALDSSGNESWTESTVTVSNASFVDTQAPTVVITSPASGSQLGKMLIVTVNASDNVAVSRAELFFDGVMVASSTTAPFTLKWNPRKVSPGAHSVQVRALDPSGNAGWSQAVGVVK